VYMEGWVKNKVVTLNKITHKYKITPHGEQMFLAAQNR